MVTNEQDREKATGLQRALETQLIALEKLGALPTHAADEIRNIVAEGIADKFGENYRTFPCAREGIEIRRDAVPKQCTLRKSVQEFVAKARSPEKISKINGQEGKKKVAAKTVTAKERPTFNALAQVNAAQRNPKTTIGHAARYKKTAPRKTASPEKRLPETSPNPANPIKDGTSKDLQQASLENGKKAWDVLLAQKAAANKTTARAGDQQKPITPGTVSLTAPVTQRTGVGQRKDQGGAAAATPQNEDVAPKEAMASQSLAAAAETNEAPDRHNTTGELTKHKSSSSGKTSIASSEDLIDFGF